MTKREYFGWLSMASEGEVRDVLIRADLPGEFGSAEKRGHAMDGYPVLIANMSKLTSGAPPTMQGLMSLARSGDKWIRFIIVPPDGMKDSTFRHECFHVSQFLDNPQLRQFFIGVQQPPPKDAPASTIASYAALEFEGRALAEVEAYQQANAYPAVAAVYVALDQAARETDATLELGHSVRSDFIEIATSELEQAARRVSRSPHYAGYNILNFVRRALKRKSHNEQHHWRIEDLENIELTDWFNQNRGKQVSESN